MIAVSTVRLENGCNAGLRQAMALGLVAIGLRTLLFPIAGTSADADPSLDEILRHRADAVALPATRLSSRFSAECAAADVPVVLVNRTAKGGSASSVTGDDVLDARRVASILLAGGHLRCAFLAGVEDFSDSRERQRGFTERLCAAGRSLPLRAAGRARDGGKTVPGPGVLPPAPSGILTAADGRRAWVDEALSSSRGP